jgi:SAM-dependent methyltransferase
MFKILVVLCMSFSHFIAYGAVSIEEYAKLVGNINPTRHRIPTLNRYGAAMCFSNELTDAFLEHCRDPHCKRVLEVGCAYGIKSSQIVQTGVFLVANDIDPRHLTMMKDIFEGLSRNNPHFHNVEYLLGDIASLRQEEVGIEKYDAILCENVLHFMCPHELRDTLASLYGSLIPGGRIYIAVTSCFLEKYRDIFEDNKAKGMEWPGIFEDPKGIRRPFHVFDEDTLNRELKRAGFTILTSKCITNSTLDKKYQDIHNRVIAIAQKE